ncbi:MAG: hypothetical protein ACJ74O_02615 [Frankiaceae bacterium]
MALIRDFLPSTHGLRFPNSWPAGTPDVVVHVPIVGAVSLGDASNGLCGGMAFTAADLYVAGRQPPAQASAPAGQSPLFNYVMDRLLASFHVPGGILTYYYWANAPDHDTGFGPLSRPGLARMTIHDQIPRITDDLDSGRPVPLGLVTVRSLNPGDLRHCHQVLAYGYEWSGSRITIHVYDPNQPGNDDVTIALDTSSPSRTTPIESTVHCDPIRGFFRTTYEWADPRAIAGPPWIGPGDR